MIPQRITRLMFSKPDRLKMKKTTRVKRSIRLDLESMERRELLTATLLQDIGQAAGSVLQVLPTSHGTYFTSLNSQGDENLAFIPVGAVKAVTLGTFDVASSTSSTRGISLSNATLFGSNIVFSADGNTGDGRQAWVATPTGTSELKNLSGGAASSDPTNFTRLGSYIFFTATTQVGPGIQQTRLFRTDGTSNGTTQVTALGGEQTGLSVSSGLTVLGTELLFSGTSFAGNTPLSTGVWELQATDLGATELQAVATGASSALTSTGGYPVAGGMAYFPVASGAQAGLWQTNGTAAGTKPVTTANLQPISAPTSLTPVGSSLFLASTTGSTSLLKITNNGSASSVTQLGGIPVGSALVGSYGTSTDFFYLLSSVNGLELRHIAASGITSNSLGVISSNPNATVISSAVVSGHLFLEVLNPNSLQITLWSTDGSTLTKLIDRLQPATGSDLAPQNRLIAGAKLVFFDHASAASGDELWASDGLTAWQVKDINPGSQGSFPRGFKGLSTAGGNSVVYFAANAGPDGVSQLWKSDGSATAPGTDSVVTGLSNSSLGSNPNNAVAMGNKTLFFANDSLTGQALWQTDGTPTGTSLLKHLDPVFGVTPLWGTTSNGTGYYLVQGDHGSSGLWQTDGTASGTTQVQSLPVTAARGAPVTFKGQLYFAIQNGAANNPNATIQLWRTSASQQAAELVLSVPFSNSSLSQLAITKDANGNDAKLFFISDSASPNPQRILWATDSGAAFQQIAKNGISLQGLASNPQASSTLGVLGSQVVFTFTDAAHGAEPWISDGTTLGTHLLTDLLSGSANALPTSFTEAGTKVVFFASTGSGGSALYATDGTPAGTQVLGNVAPGSGSAGFTKLASTTFFTGDDGIHGAELWRTNGTAAGTFMVKDLNPGVGSAFNSAQTQLLASGSNLFFTANDGQSGTQVWKTDGTAGNAQVADQFPAGLVVTTPRLLSSGAGGILLSARTTTTGFEPFFLSVQGSNRVPTISVPGSVITNPGVPVQFTAIGSDPDPGQKITYTLDAGTAPLGATIDASSGAFLWMPNAANAGATYNVAIHVTDNGVPPLSSTAIERIVVNAGPGITNNPPLGSKSVSAGTNLSFTVSATDPQGVIYSLDPSSNAPGATVDSKTGAFSWTPPANLVGTYKAVIKATEATSAAPGLSTLSTLVSVPINVQGPLVTVVSSQLLFNPKNKSQISTIQVKLSSSVLASTATSLSNYSLVLLGTKNKVTPVAVTLKYTAGGTQITITPKKPLSKTSSYRLVMSGLLDVQGRAFDGDQNGTPGGNYTVFIRKGVLKSS